MNIIIVISVNINRNCSPGVNALNAKFKLNAIPKNIWKQISLRHDHGETGGKGGFMTSGSILLCLIQGYVVNDFFIS